MKKEQRTLNQCSQCHTMKKSLVCRRCINETLEKEFMAGSKKSREVHFRATKGELTKEDIKFIKAIQ